MKAEFLDPCETPDVVDAIVAEYLDALDRGQAPPRPAWLLQYPEHAEDLARFLDDLQCLSPDGGCGTAIPRTAKRSDGTQIFDGGRPAPSEATPPVGMGNALTLTANPSGEGSKPTEWHLPLGGQFGDYELTEVVARGGMGIVFKARHRKLDRVVALKMILAGQLASELDVERFRMEARAAAGLDHPGIVPIYEVGEQQGLHFFTMAFIEGKSLAAKLHDGPLDPREAARLARELAVAIDYAHQHGIIHRDLKPANVLVDAQGQPKLTDFGLAKRVQDTGQITGTGQILGTPTYMSPEQAKGDTTVGPAADIYGLGAMLFALLTGRPPFQAATPLDTILNVLSLEPPRPCLLNPRVPRDLETICLKCLEKSPAKRYASAATLKDDLERFLDDRPILARPVGEIERVYRWYRRRPVLGTMAATLAMLLIAVPILLLVLWGEAEARAQSESNGRTKETEARKKVEAAEQARTRQLFDAYVNEAAARRASPRVGRRFEALDRIASARDLADELKLPPEEYVRLRSEAISALSLTDMRGTSNGPGWVLRTDPDPLLFRYADGNDCYLDWDGPSGLFVRRIGDNSIVQRIPVIKREDDWPDISPDNRFVAIASSDKFVVWQVEGAKPKEHVRRDHVHDHAFASDPPAVVFLTHQRQIVVQPLDGKGEANVLNIPEIQKDLRLKQYTYIAVARRQAAVVGDKRVSIVDLDAGKVTAVCSVPDTVYRWVRTQKGAMSDGNINTISCA